MAVVLGTNSGFVTVAPTADPSGAGNIQINSSSRVTKDISPSTAIKITEIGWWCDTASEEANFEVGLYAADGAVVPGEAGTLLNVSRINAKGTGAGWKVVTVDWTISSSTNYWLGVQLDSTATTTFLDLSSSGGLGRDGLASQTTLSDPYGGGAIVNTTTSIAIYAVWESNFTGWYAALV